MNPASATRFDSRIQIVLQKKITPRGEAERSDEEKNFTPRGEAERSDERKKTSDSIEDRFHITDSAAAGRRGQAEFRNHKFKTEIKITFQIRGQKFHTETRKLKSRNPTSDRSRGCARGAKKLCTSDSQIPRKKNTRANSFGSKQSQTQLLTLHFAPK